MRGQQEVRIRCLVDGGSLGDPYPLVWLTDSLGKVVGHTVYTPKARLRITERCPSTRIYECEILGQVIRRERKNLILGVQSKGKKIEIRFPKDAVQLES